MGINKDERTLGEMFAELSTEIRTLIQQELRLAKTELTEKAATFGKSAGLIIGGGLLAHGGLLTLIAAVVLGLISAGLPAWAAAVVGGTLVASIGYMLIRWGLSTLAIRELAPQQTIETLKEDVQWLKSQVK